MLQRTSSGTVPSALLPTQPDRLAQDLHAQLLAFVTPLLAQLHSALDLRLVRTLCQSVEALLRLRDRPQALWLTEVATVLLGGAHAPAGVKRLTRLLANPGWSSETIERWLLERADTLVAGLTAPPTAPAAPASTLVCLDASVAEKPESLKAEGLCRVRSSKARRLARPRPGFGSGAPPARPITVPGIHWLGATVTGWTGPALLACCRYWSPTAPGDPEAEPAGHGQTASEAQLLRDLVRRWGTRVLFVADRGFARRPFLDLALDLHARFVIRWPKRHRLVLPGLPAHLATNAWRLTAGRRAWGHERVWDPKRREWLQVAFLAVAVRLPDGPGAARALWLVVSRGRKGTEPWRLLTNEPIASVEDARRIVRVYARRWQVECAFRFGKSDLGCESVRLRDWDRRMKLLALLTLAYAFLVTLLVHDPDRVQQALRLGCHRTGAKSQAAVNPLYRLHAALAFLWAAYLPPPLVHPLRM